jgi:ABC-type multidrug transport system fused ATPase/permease subunit
MTRTPENQSRPSFVDTRPLLRLAADFVRPYSRLAGLILFLMAIEASLTGGMAYYLEEVVNTLFTPKREPNMLIIVPLVLLGIMSLKATVSYFHEHLARQGRTGRDQ